LTKPIKQEVLLRSINQGTLYDRAQIIREESSETSMTPLGTHPFAKLIPGYLLNCRMNIIAMRDALDRTDFETVRILGHQMGGTGAMYGFQFIPTRAAPLSRQP
jgi:hypothetical protein